MIIYSSAGGGWIINNLVQQDAALDSIYAAIRANDNRVLTLGAQLEAIQSEVATLSDSIEQLLDTFTRPATGRILINGKETTMPTPIPDSDKFSFAVVYDDLANREVPENAPTVWTVVDAAGAPSTLAILTVDPTSDQKGSGTLTASSGSFKLHATMGTLNLQSDQLDITPGAPATGVITVSVVAPA